MDSKQTGKQVAQPAKEEIKKHGDQLERQVKDAAGQPRQETGDKPEQADR